MKGVPYFTVRGQFMARQRHWAIFFAKWRNEKGRAAAIAHSNFRTMLLIFLGHNSKTLFVKRCDFNKTAICSIQLMLNSIYWRIILLIRSSQNKYSVIVRRIIWFDTPRLFLLKLCQSPSIYEDSRTLDHLKVYICQNIADMQPQR